MSCRLGTGVQANVQTSDNAVATTLTWKLLCKSDIRQPHSQLLEVCYGLACEGILSGKPKTDGWTGIMQIAMGRWLHTCKLGGKAAKMASFDTSKRQSGLAHSAVAC